jgi:hypothetical protein
MKIDSAKLYQELNKRTEFYAAQVRKIYDNRISEIIQICDSLEVSDDKPFKFSDYEDIAPKAQELLRKMYSEIYQSVRGNIVREWNYSNLSNDKLVQGIFGKKSIDDNHFAQYFQRNKEAMNTFFARKEQGLDLSQRVWRYVGQAKEELEFALDLGLGEGLSADELSRAIRQSLREPDKLFRRVRNKHGNLVLSKSAKAYHPGRGVYRSSYKNAQRLTRTETNMAYRSADTARWEQLDFVTGYEVKLSNNHPDSDICDELAGKYPKTFKFKGWHPNCRCYIVPILCTEEELEQLTGMILNGEDTSDFSPKGIIEDVPEGFTNWINEHSEQINTAINVPYFILDNYRDGDIEKGFNWVTDIQAKAYEKAVKVAGNVLNVANEWIGIVDVQKLQQLLTGEETKAIREETKVLAQAISKAKKEALALYAEQPTEWGLVKEFGKEDADNFLKNWYKHIDKAANMSDSEFLEKVIKKELHYAKLNPDKYQTTQKFIYYFEKLQTQYETKIAKQELLENVQHSLDYAVKTKSEKVKKLALDIHSMFGNESTSLKNLQAKIDEINKEVARLEQEKAKLETKKGKLLQDEYFGADAYTKARKDAAMWAKTAEEADKQVRDVCGQVWQNATIDERDAAFRYTGGSYFINEPLRGQTYLGSKTGSDKAIKNLTEIINKSFYDFDMWLQRGVDSNSIRGMFNFEMSGKTENEVRKALLNAVGSEPAFSSCGNSKGNGFSSNPIIYNIYAPRGTKMLYAEPFSDFGTGSGYSWDGIQKQKNFGHEAEMILQRGTKFRVAKVEHKGGKWYIDMEVIGQI